MMIMRKAGRNSKQRTYLIKCVVEQKQNKIEEVVENYNVSNPEYHDTRTCFGNRVS